MLTSSPAPSRAPSYAAVLRTPHAARPFAAALLGRLSYGIAPLSLLLALKAATGSYSVAGGAMALFGVASVSLSPARAALIDRYGPRRVLPPMAGLYAALLAVIALATWNPGAPALLLGGLSTAAGACTPPLGPVMRALWSSLVPDRELLQRAYSLDGVAEELMYVTAPLLVGIVVTFTVPAAGVLAGAVLVFVGAAGLATSPAVPRARTGQPRAGAPGAPRLRLHGIVDLRNAVLVTAGVGLCLGALDLLVVAFTERLHQAAAVSWVLAALSAGSAVGGLAYGAVRWRSSSRARLPVVAAALGAALLAAGMSPHLYVLAALVAVAGLFVAPALTTAYLIADESVDAARRTQAGAWVNTAFNAGSAGGTAAVGLLVDRLPLALCFALAAAPALLCAAAVARGGARRRRTAKPSGSKAPDAVGGV
ncbi:MULTISPECIES: MFS transporter [unclassified Streptomyces]|uniref:MFS transporter n=1 Tax=unclassified Streptomyces TaxID=2593676 RepID=UPI0025563E49|nr:MULTISPECIES: MFS transporter [unclassified Streptomyces]WRZ68198.1 MFS transporter [Streptomyces sp. NBC_01257]WSU62142.1 MFS transporter [Streptomyces sp. NBC_01104]